MSESSQAPPRTALVTGANRGLGLETARQLRRRGYRVIVAARDPSKAERAAAGVDGAALALDVADADSVRAAATVVADRWAPLDALVNNAGVALDGFDAQVVERTLAVNVYGAMAVTDTLTPLLSNVARVVMVSSGMGSLSVVSRDLADAFLAPDLDRPKLRALLDDFRDAVAAGRHRREGWPSSAYSVSKVALGALTRIVAREFSGSGRTVNAVCPGWVRTDMGGAAANRSVEEGARGIVWAATLPDGGPSGGFFRDGRAIDW